MVAAAIVKQSASKTQATAIAEVMDDGLGSGDGTVAAANLYLDFAPLMS